MSASPHILSTALEACQAGYSLPQEFYNDADVFQADIDAIFYQEWLFAAPECEIPNAGDYITLAVHEALIIVLRDKQGEIRAFHNTCRHRGSRLCDKARGNKARLVCPYHQWTYDD
jgi:Rieske 2Fe-2S family protein